MNKGMLTVGIILLSVIALLLINVLTNYSSGSELDYYLVKETTNAAMTDAMDYDYLRTCGLPRIDKEKLVGCVVVQLEYCAVVQSPASSYWWHRNRSRSPGYQSARMQNHPLTSMSVSWQSIPFVHCPIHR